MTTIIKYISQVRGGDMSYKDDIKQQIKKCIENVSHDEKAIAELLENSYNEALYESKKAGQSVESMTYEILEGVEEGCLSKPEYAEEVLENALNIISNAIRKSAQEHIYRKKKKLYWAEVQLSDTIEAEQACLEEAMEAYKQYAKEKSFKTLEKRLYAYESKLSESICILADKIKYNNKIV